MKRFRPRFIEPNELAEFGLPDGPDQANILSLVDGASKLIDEWCGRTDGDGNGSLVYSTYTERLLMQAAGRNILRVSFRPMTAVTPSTQVDIMASGNAGSANTFYTGFVANTTVRPDTSLSPIIGASGRYGYGRRNSQAIYPDLNYGMNPLQVAAYFGGPPGWTPIDVSAIDFDTQTGEIWVPAGLYMSAYTEILISYNSGFDPRSLPYAIKTTTASLVRNFLARGGGTTSLRSMSAAGGVNVTFTDEMIDVTLERYLSAYKTVIAY